MALMITEDCIGCAVCLPECDNEAIRTDADGQFFIRAGYCTECVGNHPSPRCQTVCPVASAITKNPRRSETHEELTQKAKRIKVRLAFEKMMPADNSGR